MTDPSPTTVAQDYPLTINIEYPAARKRWSVLARVPLGLPVVFFALLLNIGATLAIWGRSLRRGGSRPGCSRFR